MKMKYKKCVHCVDVLRYDYVICDWLKSPHLTMTSCRSKSCIGFEKSKNGWLKQYFLRNFKRNGGQ